MDTWFESLRLSERGRPWQGTLWVVRGKFSLQGEGPEGASLEQWCAHKHECAPPRQYETLLWMPMSHFSDSGGRVCSHTQMATFKSSSRVPHGLNPSL